MPHGRRAPATGLLRSHSPARFFFIVKKNEFIWVAQLSDMVIFFFVCAYIYAHTKKKINMLAFYDKQNDLCKIRCLLFKNPVVRCSKFCCPLA